MNPKWVTPKTFKSVSGTHQHTTTCTVKVEWLIKKQATTMLFEKAVSTSCLLPRITVLCHTAAHYKEGRVPCTSHFYNTCHSFVPTFLLVPVQCATDCLSLHGRKPFLRTHSAAGVKATLGGSSSVWWKRHYKGAGTLCVCVCCVGQSMSPRAVEEGSPGA